jgi:DNA-directed RNA polymerase subunit RPC12/RpoP
MTDPNPDYRCTDCDAPMQRTGQAARPGGAVLLFECVRCGRTGRIDTDAEDNPDLRGMRYTGPRDTDPNP